MNKENKKVTGNKVAGYIAPKSLELIRQMKQAKDKRKEAKQIIEALQKEYSRLNSAITLLTPVRKALTTNEYFYKEGNITRHVLSFDKKLLEQNRIAMKSQANEKLRNSHLLQSKDYSPLVKFAVKWLETGNTTLIALALLALTGRRTSEIFGKPCFKKVGKNKVTFTGQIKTQHSVPYDIPVLHDADAIIKAQRKVSTNLDPSEINRKFAMALSRSVKFMGVQKVHDLRHIYAGLAYERFGSGERTAYTSSILGNGMDVAITYSDSIKHASNEKPVKEVKGKAVKEKPAKAKPSSKQKLLNALAK